MELGRAPPTGPLRLLDVIGLDTAQAVAEST
jgi:3-hydroxyacyl-CoA dehydrogenase